MEQARAPLTSAEDLLGAGHGVLESPHRRERLERMRKEMGEGVRGSFRRALGRGLSRLRPPREAR